MSDRLLIFFYKIDDSREFWVFVLFTQARQGYGELMLIVIPLNLTTILSSLSSNEDNYTEYFIICITCGLRIHSALLCFVIAIDMYWQKLLSEMSYQRRGFIWHKFVEHLRRWCSKLKKFSVLIDATGEQTTQWPRIR